MGFAVAYESTKKLAPEHQARVRNALERATDGRTWLSCEPPMLMEQDGHLVGVSKPNFSPDPDDIADAESQNLPDGTLMDLLDALCKVSAEQFVDWELSHDHGPMGFILDGACAPDVREQCEALAEAAEMMGGDFDMDAF